jgi:hypothetical protein
VVGGGVGGWEGVGGELPLHSAWVLGGRRVIFSSVLRVACSLCNEVRSLAGQPPTYCSTGCISSPAHEGRVWRLHCTSHGILVDCQVTCQLIAIATAVT